MDLFPVMLQINCARLFWPEHLGDQALEKVMKQNYFLLLNQFSLSTAFLVQRVENGKIHTIRKRRKSNSYKGEH